IDMMDDILLNPKNANPYISCMYINVLIDKVKNDYVNTDSNFRKRAYKSMLDNAIVCGELGTRNIALSLEKNFLNNEDGFGNKKFNPFTFDKDAIETQKEVINTIWRIFNLRKKHKEEICLYLKDKKQKSPDDFAK
ncbi:MAG: hypothetical protein IJT25_03900, partial [Clostridia bacterium]|nr:hypothetical protein [Clostridia bacterium]